MDDVELIEHHLKKGDISFTSTVVETRNGYEKALAEFKPDVVLSDHSLPMFDSMLALQRFHSYRKIYNPAAAFILVTGTVSEEFAVQIMKAGADDYILKDRFKRLPAAVENAIEKNRLKDQRRKEEEEKLYLFDILQRSLHEIYVINPKDYHFEYVNKAAVKNLGYSMEELKKLKTSDLIDDFNADDFSEAIAHIRKGKRGLLFEGKAKRKDQSTYPVQIHLQVIGQGEQLKILSNVIDITEAKQFEEQKELSVFIQNSFNHTRNLRESLEPILEKIAVLCSCEATEFYAQEFDRTGPKILAHYNDGANHVSQSGQLIAQKVYETGTLQVVNLEGVGIVEDEKWTKELQITTAVGIPISLGSDLIAVLVAFTTNSGESSDFSILSEQVQNKLAGNIKRKRTEEELQKIFDCSPDILMVVGKDGIIKKNNSALQKILGYNAQEMAKLTVDDLIHPEDRPVVESWRNAVSSANEIVQYESRWLTKNGEYKWFSWSVTSYYEKDMDVVVGRDVTESKRQLKAIQEQNKKLTEIAWEQSHVVRAPLTRLLACVEYLEETGRDSNEILASVKNSAYEIDEIVKGIINKSEKVDMNGKG